jgi:hypothetical protein
LKLTNQQTIVLGVVSVNNPNSSTIKGSAEEIDVQLRIRRNKSLSIGGRGYMQTLYLGLSNISNVSFWKIYENITNITDDDGIDTHGIWVIIEGGNDDEIADVIYSYRPLDIPMKGSVSYDITQINGSKFQIKFDRTDTQPLYISLTLTSSEGILNPDYIKLQIAQTLTLDIYQLIDITTITALVKEISSMRL